MSIPVTCFDSIDRQVSQSSDFISAKKNAAIFGSLAVNVVKGKGYNPIKKNGKKYQSNFIARECANDKRKAKLTSAKNYDLLLSVTKGKYILNPNFDGAQAAKYQSVAGNLAKVVYGDDKRDQPILYYTPKSIADSIRKGELNYESNIMQWDNGLFIDDGDTFNNTYPGFKIDPFNKLFYNKCVNKKSNMNTGFYPWTRNLTSLINKDTNYYWKIANAQPLTGFIYPQQVALWLSLPVKSDFLPVINGSNDPRIILDKYCEGKGRIN